MNTVKKISLVFLAIAISVAAVLGMVACKQSETVKDTEIILTVDSSVMADIEGKSLVDYMAALKEKNKLSYEGSVSQYGLYVQSINGREADSKTEWWALYTDDAEFSNEAYGTYTASDGATYAMASVGASSVMIKEGKKYVWVIQLLS